MTAIVSGQLQPLFSVYLMHATQLQLLTFSEIQFSFDVMMFLKFPPLFYLAASWETGFRTQPEWSVLCLLQVLNSLLLLWMLCTPHCVSVYFESVMKGFFKHSYVS